jgi:hypothetical protein
MNPTHCTGRVGDGSPSGGELSPRAGSRRRPSGFARALEVSLLLLLAVIGLLPVSVGFAYCPCQVQIMLDTPNGEENITGQTYSPWYVGEYTYLYASYTPPSGVSVTSQSWSVQGTVVAGFDEGAPGGPVYTTSGTFSGQSTTFYWSAPGNSEEVTFTLDLSDGENETIYAFIDVAGPTSVGATNVTQPSGGDSWFVSSGYLDCGADFPNNECMGFQGYATSPAGDAGQYEWVQVVTETFNYLFQGSYTWYCPMSFTTPALDNQVPYGYGLPFSDSPGEGPLVSASTYSGQEWPLDFTDYLMWNPGIFPNNIPVPLGNVDWFAVGNATSNGSTWTANLSDSFNTEESSFEASSSTWPSWFGVATNGGGNWGQCQLYQ